MKESDLRKWHRNLGIFLALFIFLQTGSGFFISFGELSVSLSDAHEDTNVSPHNNKEGDSPKHGGIGFIHHGAGLIGGIYRILLGFGLIMMAVSGSTIFFKIRTRSKKR